MPAHVHCQAHRPDLEGRPAESFFQHVRFEFVHGLLEEDEAAPGLEPGSTEPVPLTGLDELAVSARFEEGNAGRQDGE